MALGDVLFTLRSKFDSAGTKAAQAGLKGVTTALGAMSNAFGLAAKSAAAMGLALKAIVAIKFAAWAHGVIEATREQAAAFKQVEYQTGVNAERINMLQNRLGAYMEQAELVTKVVQGEAAATRELADTNKNFARIMEDLNITVAEFVALPADQRMRMIEKSAYGARAEIENLTDSWASFKENFGETFDQDIDWKHALGITELERWTSEAGNLILNLGKAGFGDPEDLWAQLFGDETSEQRKARLDAEAAILMEGVEGWRKKMALAAGEGVDEFGALNVEDVITELKGLNDFFEGGGNEITEDISALDLAIVKMGGDLRRFSEESDKDAFKKVYLWLLQNGPALAKATQSVANSLFSLHSAMSNWRDDEVTRFSAVMRAMHGGPGSVSGAYQDQGLSAGVLGAIEQVGLQDWSAGIGGFVGGAAGDAAGGSGYDTAPEDAQNAESNYPTDVVV